MVSNFIIVDVGNYTETDWQNPRTGERKVIKSFPLVLGDGNETIYAEASDQLAEEMSKAGLLKGQVVSVSLSFSANKVEKDGVARYYQQVRIRMCSWK